MTKGWNDARDKALFIALLNSNVEVSSTKFEEVSVLINEGNSGGWNACQ